MSSFSVAKSKQASWRETLGATGEREGSRQGGCRSAGLLWEQLSEVSKTDRPSLCEVGKVDRIALESLAKGFSQQVNPSELMFVGQKKSIASPGTFVSLIPACQLVFISFLFGKCQPLQYQLKLEPHRECRVSLYGFALVGMPRDQLPDEQFGFCL